ncbi:MAG: hypothetical protein NTY26_17690 [Burkholderiales bacterium]|nr:hypothetical protein [Burkholderiales bacterium]
MTENEGRTRSLEAKLVYSMHSGLAARSNDPGIVHINGSGWHAPLGYYPEPLKDTPLGLPYIIALCQGGNQHN